MRSRHAQHTRSLALIVLAAGSLAACSQPPAKRSKEYFPSSVYGAVSPRVVEDGQPVPKGGGRYLVGKPYSIAGRVYTPKEVSTNTSQTGKASWYGAAFHGRRTSNGEVYDMRSVTAAHPTWPLPSYVRVTNVANGRSMIVRLNDRGPFHSDRIMDVSSRVADALDFKRIGTATIKLDYVSKAGLAGSDDQILMASLRTDGKPASLDSYPTNPGTMIAQSEREPEPVREVAASGFSSIFQSRPEPQPQPERVQAVAQSEAPQGIVPPPGYRLVDVLPPPRPSWLQQPVQFAQVIEPAPRAQVTNVVPSTSFASRMPAFPPLPPVRPLSLGALAPMR